VYERDANYGRSGGGVLACFVSALMAEIIYGARTRAGLELDMIGRRHVALLHCRVQRRPRASISPGNSMPSCIETGATRVENGRLLVGFKLRRRDPEGGRRSPYGVQCRELPDATLNGS